MRGKQRKTSRDDPRLVAHPHHILYPISRGFGSVIAELHAVLVSVDGGAHENESPAGRPNGGTP